jgi:hypothetical protein
MTTPKKPKKPTKPQRNKDRPPLPDGWSRQFIDDTEHVYDENGVQRCGSWRRHRAGICKKYTVQGRNRCRLHGGKAPIGAEAPQFKNGVHSKYARSLKQLDVIKEFNEIRSDPDLLRMDDEIALLAMRIGNLVETIGDNPPIQFKDLARNVRQIRDAWKQGDNQRAQAQVMVLLDAIDEGAKQESRMDELYQAIEVKRRVTETETKRRVQASKTLTADEVAIILARIHSVIENNVDDPATIQKIGYELLNVTGE